MRNEELKLRITHYALRIVFAAIIFSLACANVHAAVVDVSSDDIASFMAKCNAELKKTDANNNLDVPALGETFKVYSETLPLTEGNNIKFTYTTRDDKIYSIKLDAEKFDADAKKFFEGMSIVYLKSLGLSETDARTLAKGEEKAEWRNEKFVAELGKKFIVSFKTARLTIVATDR